MTKFERNKLLWQRHFVRMAGDFESSDKLRDELLKHGIEVFDTKEGFTHSGTARESWLENEVLRLNADNEHLKKVMRLRDADSHGMITKFQDKYLNYVYGDKSLSR